MSDIIQLDGHGDGAQISNSLDPLPEKTLRSLIPVLERLGDCVCIQNRQYLLTTSIPEEVWSRLQEFLRSVEEVDLLTPDTDPNGNTIADMTFVQLALSMRGATGLFPFLKRIRIINPGESSSLLFLPLLLSQCLQTVKIIGIDNLTGIALENFISKNATETLKNLTIHSSIFLPSATVLDSCTALETLEFISSQNHTSISVHISSLVQHHSLQEYKISSGQDKYHGTPNSLTITAVFIPPALDIIFDGRQWETIEINDQSAFHPPAAYLGKISSCPSIQSFNIKIQEDVYYGRGTSLAVVTQTAGSTPWSIISSWKSLTNIKVLDMNQISILPAQHCLNAISSLPNLLSFDLGVGGDIYTLSTPHFIMKAYYQEPPLSKLSFWQDLESMDISDPTFHPTEDYFNVVLAQTSLKEFKISSRDYNGCHGIFNRTSIDGSGTRTLHLILQPRSTSRLPLPLVEIHQLSLHLVSNSYDGDYTFREISRNQSHCLRDLSIFGNISQLSENLLRSTKWDHLANISLPILTFSQSTQATHLSLPSLKILAEQCPQLASLQAMVSLPLVDSFNPPGGFKSCLISHSLHILSMGSLTAPLKKKSKKSATLAVAPAAATQAVISPKLASEIARYLCALFPNLEIRSHIGSSESSWNAISEFVQLIQAMRGDFVHPSASQVDGADGS